MAQTALLSLILFFWSGFAGASFTADATGSYNWGDYSSENADEDNHSGAGLSLFAGYRLNLNNIGGIKAGLTGLLSYPELGTQKPGNTASFSSQALGTEVAYLWRNRFEPLVQYYPYTKLSQTNGQLVYSGHAFGLGTRIYLTTLESREVQMGLKFHYLRESYSSASFNPSVVRNGDGLLSGDTYLMGLFIGI